MGKLALAIIADDLTGAMDCCGYFGRLGFAVEVGLSAPYSSEPEILAVTTNSRAEPEAAARARVTEAARQLAPRRIFKKIDSTLRGNIGVELSALLEESGARKALVAPAFPEMGRTTVNGVMLLDGVPVSETSFGADSVLPVKESNIAVLLRKSSRRPVATVGVEEVEAGAEALHARIASGPEEMWVCDATRAAHLRTIVRAAALAEGGWLLCGSSGLAREAHVLLGQPDRAGRRPHAGASGPAMVLVGSLNPVSSEQLLEAKKKISFIGLDSDAVASGFGDAGGSSKTLEEAVRVLGQGRSLALSSTFSPRSPALRAGVPRFMADIAERLLRDHPIAGLFLSGGDVAWEVCRRLGLSSISVLGEIEPGIPAGVAELNEGRGLRIVTKAGGFGTRDAIVKALFFLERGELP